MYGTEAMEHLAEISTMVYLKLPYETIYGRIADTKKRGVVLRDGQTLKDLYDERCPLYEKYADLVIDVEGTTPGVALERILAALEEV